MSTQHTSGPWSIEGPDDFGDFNIHCARERAVVAAVVSNLRPADEVAANAHVVAAAPDLIDHARVLIAPFACAETRDGQHLFCGETTTAPGKPWCEAHHAIVFEPYRRGGHALAEHKRSAA